MQAELSALLGMGFSGNVSNTQPKTQQETISGNSHHHGHNNATSTTTTTSNNDNMASDISSILNSEMEAMMGGMIGADQQIPTSQPKRDMQHHAKTTSPPRTAQKQQEGFRSILPDASDSATGISQSATSNEDDFSASLASILGGAMGGATPQMPGMMGETPKGGITTTTTTSPQSRKRPSQRQPKMIVKPYIANIVASVSCSCRVNLSKLAKKMAKVKPQYNPHKYSALIFDLKKDKDRSATATTGDSATCTAHVFPNGRVLLLGCTTESDTRKYIKKIIRLLKRAVASNATASDFRIHNIIGKCNVGRRIHLERLSLKFTREANYEPELFPGLVYRITSPKAEVICFHSGEIIITGVDSTDFVQEVFDVVYPRIEPFLIEPEEIDLR